MNKMKIAVIGSCVSRDGFTTKLVPNYKDFFSVVLGQNQMSMISLMADPIPFEADNLKGQVSAYVKKQFTVELNKSLIYGLLINKPDYIIMDFYGDVFYGARQVGNSYMTNKTWEFKKINAYEELNIGEEVTYKKDKENFFSLWKESVDKFIDFLRQYLPDTKIIINKAKCVNEYIDENGELKKITEKLKHDHNLKEYNQIWSEMDAYFIENYGCRYIDYGDKIYYSKYDHIWGVYYVHFTDDFYIDFRDKLLKIVFDDLTIDKKSEVESLSRNLIVNSTFNYGKKFWTRNMKEFELIENPDGNNSVKIEKRGLEKDGKFQLWSNAVEINADGRQPYTVSFDVKVTDIDLLDSYRSIFCIRTFNNYHAIYQSDCLSYYNLTPEKLNISEDGTWTRCSFTFTPFSGRFIKIGPYLFRNGNVEWKNIQLEKGDVPTEWRPGYKEYSKERR